MVENRPPALSDPHLEARFEVLERLCHEGDVSVFKVRDRGSGELRRVEERRMPDRDGLERLAEQVRAVKPLAHSNVLRIEGLHLGEAWVYLICDHADGCTLDHVLASKQRPSLALAIEIGQQILSALTYLGGQGLALGNLSPTSFTLGRAADGRPWVRVVDLGLGDIGPDPQLTAGSIFVRRLRYTSPEEFDDPAKVSAASDIYTFGVMLYELSTGQYPIVGDSPSSLIAGHLFRPPLDFSKTDPEGLLSDPLRNLLQRTLVKDPAERIRLAPLRNALQEVGSGLPAVDPAELAAWLGPVGSAAAVFDLTLALNEIEDQIENEELAAARQRLNELLEHSGDDSRIREMAARLAAVEGFAHRREVQRLVVHSRQESSDGQHDAAVATLEQAMALTPGDPELAELLAYARQSRERNQQSDESAARPPVLPPVLSPRSQQPIIQQSSAQQPRASAGPTMLLQQVKDQVAEEDQRQDASAEQAQVDQQRRADELIAEAKILATAEKFRQASERVAAALKLTPGQPEALTLAASLDACLRIQEQEERQQLEVERTMTGIRQLLETGEGAPARHELDEATARLGEHPGLETVRYELERSRLASAASPAAVDDDEMLTVRLPEVGGVKPAATPEGAVAAPASSGAASSGAMTVRMSPDDIASAVTTAASEQRTALISVEPEPPAPDALEQPGTKTVLMSQLPMPQLPVPQLPLPPLPPGLSADPSAERPETVSIQRPRAGKPARTEVVPLTPPVESLEPPPAVHSAGQPGSPADSTGDIREAVSSRQEKGTSRTVPMDTIDQARQRYGPPASSGEIGSVTLPMKAIEEAARKRQQQMQQDAQSQIGPPASEVPPPTTPVATPPAATPPAATPPAATAPAALSDLGFGSDDDDEPPFVVPSSPLRRPLPESSSNRKLMIGGLVVAVLLAVALSLLLSGRLSLDQLTGGGGNESAPEEVAVVDLAPGSLILDARPWAEVESVTAADGSTVEPRGSRFTPTRLSLPAGKYQIEIVHPPSGNRQTLQVEIVSESEVSQRVDLVTMDAEELIRHVGW